MAWKAGLNMVPIAMLLGCDATPTADTQASSHGASVGQEAHVSGDEEVLDAGSSGWEHRIAGTRNVGSHSCVDAPSWIDELRHGVCRDESFVYGASASPRLRDHAMRFHAASNRARAKLVSDGDVRGSEAVELNRSEVIDAARCSTRVWALARRPRMKEDDGLPLCSGAVNERAAPLDRCPEWAQIMAEYSDDETITGVGFARALGNQALARQIAANRAVNEQYKSMALHVGRNGDQIRNSTSGLNVTESTDQEFAVCGDLVVARLVSRRR